VASATALQTAPAATTIPVVTPAPERVRVVQRQPKRYVKKRSGKKSALIIGGSTVGGALVGNVIGGKKATIIGGVVGATAGTVYDRKTRKKTEYR
jgi:outer membrane lipoprotein SlyB